MEKQEHVLLWTGGLDSTYRFCQLALDPNAIVKPVYIVDKERIACLVDELQAQDKIYQKIVSHPKRRAEILPLQRVGREIVPYDDSIASYEKGLAKEGLGWQFIFLAMYAKENRGCELCQETLWDCLKDKDVSFKEIDGKNYMVTDNLDRMYQVIFSNFSFPIMDVTREKMVKNLHSWGFKHLLKDVWFCYHAIDGHACGICINCRKKINDGLSFLFTPEAIKRYLVYRYVYNFHYKMSCTYLDEYCRNHGNPELSPVARQYNNGIVVLRDACFSYYKKLFACSNAKLKSLIINGSEKYGLRLCLRERISDFRNNKTRRKNYEYLFRTIKD